MYFELSEQDCRLVEKCLNALPHKCNAIYRYEMVNSTIEKVLEAKAVVSDFEFNYLKTAIQSTILHYEREYEYEPNAKESKKGEAVIETDQKRDKEVFRVIEELRLFEKKLIMKKDMELNHVKQKQEIGLKNE